MLYPPLFELLDHLLLGHLWPYRFGFYSVLKLLLEGFGLFLGLGSRVRYRLGWPFDLFEDYLVYEFLHFGLGVDVDRLAFIVLVADHSSSLFLGPEYLHRQVLRQMHSDWILQW